MNFDRLRYIAERTEIGEQKEAILRYNCLKKLVHFWIFCRVLQGRNITEFNYRMDATNPNTAHVFVGIGLKEGQKERILISDTLVKKWLYSL